jgi:hypothetical protein
LCLSFDRRPIEIDHNGQVDKRHNVADAYPVDSGNPKM